ncbi:PEGA domain protein [Minicystis rosea]|nr:PEGA domain protein [Minicystis rosea]
MRRRSLALTAALLLSLSPLAASAQAPPAGAPPASAAKPGSEANAHFKRGVELYNEGDFNAALIEFRRAYELDPRYQALYNIGETYYQLQDYAHALETLTSYLAKGGAQIADGRREEVQKEIEKLRTRVATIDVMVRIPGVEITVDDVPAGRTPLAAPITVSAGRRKITASRPGKPPITQIVEVAGGDAKKIAIEITDDAEPEKPRSVPAAPWVVTGVLTAGAVVTGVLALGASSSVKDELAAMPGDASKISSAHGKAVALGITTDILAGAAIVMAGVSIYFTVAAQSPKRTEKAAVAVHLLDRGEPPKAAVRLTAGPRSLLLTGSF